MRRYHVRLKLGRASVVQVPRQHFLLLRTRHHALLPCGPTGQTGGVIRQLRKAQIGKQSRTALRGYPAVLRNHNIVCIEYSSVIITALQNVTT